jgi:hypothetical protein
MLLRTGIEDPPVIVKILGHLGVSTHAPPRGQSATSSTRANACAFFALPDALDATTVIYVLIAAG